MRRGVRDTGLVDRLIAALVEFQSPSCGAVFGTATGTSGREHVSEFQSPSCGAVFGTFSVSTTPLPTPNVSVAFMRRGVRDLRPGGHGAPSLGVSVAFMRRGVRDELQACGYSTSPHCFSRLHAARCSGQKTPAASLPPEACRFSRLHAARCSGR